MELDLGAVRAFVAVAGRRRFGEAADELGLSQQAVSKRIAKLETDLGTTLLRRTPAGAEPTEDGAAFLLPARALLATADQAVDAVRSRRRALRVDVLGTRLATTELVRDFHESTGADVEIITSDGLRSAVPALLRGSVDAAFARVLGPLDPALAHTPVCLDPLHVLVGATHPLAGRREVTMAELAGTTAWMPGNTPGTEWTAWFTDLAAEFALHIETRGPNFGFDHLLDEVARSTTTVTFAGEGVRVPWHPDLVRIPVAPPVPCYPHFLLWRRDNRHPLLPGLVAHLKADYHPPTRRECWLAPPDRHLFAG
ncbi:LysR family transcriptional regulator [Pseudonocardia cypriaca]|uniref:DNA-binding transcriptional LysR family regulator n=1 Tax=Pseudonocardia cypriaca TaxID=882449 RepID=A0A543GGI7_9PSEU|nr:LysR family transcriptional regulator [Pseudonocardia cypriaca]TQM45199.1 DNA-binding transcriptional LysR family regulator [Pseudonocardia cypriaca]